MATVTTRNPMPTFTVELTKEELGEIVYFLGEKVGGDYDLFNTLLIAWQDGNHDEYPEAPK